MWVFLGMETIANIKYRSHVDSDSCLLAVCRWLIPHEVAPQQSFTMLQPANAKVIIKNGTTKNNHIYFILQFDPLKHSINNSSCNLTYTPKLRHHHLVDKHNKPLLSHPRAAILAVVISQKLDLNPKWTFLEKLWGIEDLATLHSKAKERNYYAALFKEYSNLLS